jgi:tetratricopeptide (TPR) repeat protein
MFGHLPDPQEARSAEDIAELLRALKVWAGDPSYETIKKRVNDAWRAEGRPLGELTKRSTVADCFKSGRRRFSTGLVIAIVQALSPDEGYVAQWQQALRALGGQALASSQVSVLTTLPVPVAGFTGRDRELALARRTGTSAVTVITAIDGMAGVGKTQLAIKAGHLLAASQPFDQTLFVDLRGFHPDPAHPPADPAAVLDSFLRLLGVPGPHIPHELSARADLYRQRLSGKRVLVVLDNAADESQIEPLLPDRPGCVALVTSRRDLSGLPRAERVAVDVFTPAESLDFLRQTVPGDDDALVRVADRCGHLPLALSLVVAHMRSRPDWTTADHADWLDERHHDGRLEVGVEIALGLSYQDLPDDLQRLFRLLALHPGDEFDVFAAAVLADAEVAATRERLDRLVTDNLLRRTAPGRFSFHDLVRAFAYDRTKAEDRLTERRAASSRLADYYLMASAAAMDLVAPAERDRRPTVTCTAPIPPFADSQIAGRWLDTERANIVATVLQASGEHKILLSGTLFRYLDTGGHHSEATSLHEHARSAAREAGDTSAEAHALTNLGLVHMRQGRLQEAADQHLKAIETARAAGDRVCEARASTNLGGAYWLLGRYEDAARRHQDALDILRDLGDPLGQAQAFGNLALVQGLLGKHEQELANHHRALVIFREFGHRIGEARTLGNLGEVYCELGRHELAIEHHRLALNEMRALGERNGEATALSDIGIVYERLSDWQSAAEYYAQAVARFAELGQPQGEARAHHGLAKCYRNLGQQGKARRHAEQALRIHADGPVAEEVRVTLAELDRET